jgi:hypothetical protein
MCFSRRKESKEEYEERLRRYNWRCSYTGMSISTNDLWMDAVSIRAFDWAALIMKEYGIPFYKAIKKSIWCVHVDFREDAVKAVEKIYKRKKETIL